MLSKRKRDSSICQIKHNNDLFVSVRRFCLINESVIGIGNVFQTMHENIFDTIAKPSISNPTLKNRSNLINRYMYKVKKLSVSNAVVAFTASSIIQLCVHVPIKHSETDFIILQPNLFEHH